MVKISIDKKAKKNVERFFEGLIVILYHMVLIPLIASIFAIGLFITSIVLGSDVTIFDMSFISSLVTMILVVMSNNQVVQVKT